MKTTLPLAHLTGLAAQRMRLKLGPARIRSGSLGFGLAAPCSAITETHSDPNAHAHTDLRAVEAVLVTS